MKQRCSKVFFSSIEHEGVMTSICLNKFDCLSLTKKNSETATIWTNMVFWWCDETVLKMTFVDSDSADSANANDNNDVNVDINVDIGAVRRLCWRSLSITPSVFLHYLAPPVSYLIVSDLIRELWPDFSGQGVRAPNSLLINVWFAAGWGFARWKTWTAYYSMCGLLGLCSRLGLCSGLGLCTGQGLYSGFGICSECWKCPGRSRVPLLV